MRRGGNVDAASPRQRSVLGGTISTPDLAVLGFGLGVLAATGWRRDRQLLSVVAGLACFAASDILVLRAINAGRWHVGVANAIVYATAVLLVEMSCWVVPFRPSPGHSAARRILGLPILAVLLAVGVLLAGAVVAIPGGATGCC